MNRWNKFLESLSTRGGSIFVLMLCNIGLTSLVIHLIHDGETTGAIAVTISTLLGNFSGALLVILTGQDKKLSVDTPEPPIQP